MLAFLKSFSKETKDSNNSSSQPSSSSSHVGLSSSSSFSSFAIAKTPEQHFLSAVVKRLLMDDPRHISGSIYLDTHLMRRDPIAALDAFIKSIKLSPHAPAASIRKDNLESEKQDLKMQDMDASLGLWGETGPLASIINTDSPIIDITRLTSETGQLDQKLQRYKTGAEIRGHRLAEIEKISAMEEHELLRMFEDERRQSPALDKLYNALYKLSRSTLAYQDIVSVLGPYAASTLVKVINDLYGLSVILQELTVDKRQTFLVAIKIHLTTIMSSGKALLRLFEDLSPALRLEILPIFDDVFRNTRLTYASACELLILLPEDSWDYVLGLLGSTMSAANIHRIRVWTPILAQSKDNKINDNDKIQYFKQSLDGRISPEDFFVMFGRTFLSPERQDVGFHSLAHELFGASFMTMAESALTKGQSIVNQALKGTPHLPDLSVVLRVIDFYLYPPFLHRVSSWRSDESIVLATEIQRFLSTTQQGTSLNYSEYLQYKLENADINAFGTFSGLIHALQARLASGPAQAPILSSSSSSSSRRPVPSSSNSRGL